MKKSAGGVSEFWQVWGASFSIQNAMQLLKECSLWHTCRLQRQVFEGNKSRWWRWNPSGLLWQTYLRRHRNCFQTRPLQAFPKKWTSLGVRGQLMQSPACTERKRSILRGQSSRRNYTQVDFEVDCPPPADFPPWDLLITMVKETVIIIKRVMKKSETCSVSLIDLIAMKTLLPARLPVTVSSVQTWS